MKKGLFWNINLIFLFIVSWPMVAYSYAIVQRPNLWLEFHVFGYTDSSKLLQYHLELQPRLRDGPNHLRQFIMRPSIGIPLNSRMKLWFGYYFSPNISRNGHNLYENRLWQQLSWLMVKDDHFHLISRARLEQRRLQNFPQWGLRFRQRMTLLFPGYFAVTPVVYDEIFLNVTHPVWVRNILFGQNRAFVGVEYHFNKTYAIRVGYLNQYVNLPRRDLLDHVALLSFRVDLD